MLSSPGVARPPITPEVQGSSSLGKELSAEEHGVRPGVDHLRVTGGPAAHGELTAVPTLDADREVRAL